MHTLARYLVATFLLLATATGARAASVPAFDFSITSFAASGPLTVGFEFRVEAGAEVVVTDLGFFDEGGDGLRLSHDVAIWSTNDTSTPRVQATVLSFTADELVNGFRYRPVTPTTLEAGTYRIGGENDFIGSVQDPIALTGSALSDPRLTITQDQVFRVDKGYPNQVFDQAQYYTVNFRIEPIPIPAALWLFGAGIVALGAVVRRPLKG